MWQWLSDWKRMRNAAKFDYTLVAGLTSPGLHDPLVNTLDTAWRCNVRGCGEIVYDGLQKLHAMTQHGFHAPNVLIHPNPRVPHQPAAPSSSPSRSPDTGRRLSTYPIPRDGD